MMRWLLPLALLIFFESVADIFAKNWSLQRTAWMAVVSLLFYLIANSFWLFALKNGSGLGRGAVIFSVVSALLAVVLGVIFYKESVNKYQLLGFVFGIISLVLIFWDGE